MERYRVDLYFDAAYLEDAEAEAVEILNTLEGVFGQGKITLGTPELWLDTESFADQEDK